jgi:hypothetical protein
VSGVGGKVADATLGTTVYMRATDGNGNQRRGIAIEQSNFYGEVAGDLITGNDFTDDEVAERFGKVSGFSASVGVLFRDISELVDDPTAFIEGTSVPPASTPVLRWLTTSGFHSEPPNGTTDLPKPGSDPAGSLAGRLQGGTDEDRPNTGRTAATGRRRRS